MRKALPGPALVLELGNKGLLGMQVPVALGGLLGLSCFEQMRVQRQLGAIDLTLAFFVGLNNGLGIRPLVRFASPELQQRYLPQLATGRMLAAFAVTEPCAGSNPLGMRTEASAKGRCCGLAGTRPGAVRPPGRG
jgi:alkylation response protein AidB-like acyl-CoA dehydrogenase